MTNFPPGVNMDRVLGGPNDINCDCNDPSCPGLGEEGEVLGHIDNCTCTTCHHHYEDVGATGATYPDDFKSEDEEDTHDPDSSKY